MDPKLKLPRTIVGIIGNVISFGLFLSPVPTIWRFFEKQSTEHFHPTNYISGILNCVLWITYGAVHPNSTLVWTINAVGLALYVVYIGAFIYFAPKKMRIYAIIGVIVVGIVIALIDGPTLALVPTTKKKSMIIGSICVAFNIVLYASPMTVVVKVVQDKSVEYLPFWVSFAGLMNGSCWTAYGLMPYDINLLIGNGLGAVLSLIQIILHFIYGNPVDEFTKPFKAVYHYFRGGRKTDQPEKTVQLENVV